MHAVMPLIWPDSPFKIHTLSINGIKFASFADRAYVESVDEYCDDVIEHVQLLKVSW
jgi:hypothetical protein